MLTVDVVAAHVLDRDGQQAIQATRAGLRPGELRGGGGGGQGGYSWSEATCTCMRQEGARRRVVGEAAAAALTASCASSTNFLTLGPRVLSA